MNFKERLTSGVSALMWWRDRDVQRTPSEATMAKERAEISLRQTKAQTAYYAALGESSKKIREANHLTELFFSNRHPVG